MYACGGNSADAFTPDGNVGYTTTDFGNDDRVAAVGVDSQGEIVAAGKWDGGASDFAIDRYTSSGALDTSFGGGYFGAASGKDNVFFGVSIGSSQDFCTDMVIQPDRSILLSGYTNANGTNDFAVARLLSDGSIDNRFNGDGRQIIDFGANDQAYGVTATYDGSIIAVGTSNTDFAVARIRGTLDLGFNKTGKLADDFGNTDTANAVVVQSDGKIVVAGSWDGGSSDFAISRYTAAGAIDSTFGAGYYGAGSGRSNVTFGTGTFGAAEFATDAVVDSLGRIVVVGYTNNVNGVAAVGGNDIAVARLLPSGALDTTFGVGGKFTYNLGGDDRAQAVIITPDGHILIAGSWDGGQSEMIVMSLTTNGTLDTNFGSGFLGTHTGITNLAMGGAVSSGQDFATDLALQSDGKIVVVGYSNAAYGYTSSDYDVAVGRLLPSGAPDPSFDGDGQRLIPIDSGSIDKANAVLIQPDGKIVIAGSTGNGSDDFLALRLLPNGANDLTFDSDGSAVLAWGNVDIATDVLLQSDGKIVLTGYTNEGGNNNMAALRLLPNGAQDTSFSTGHQATAGFDVGDRVEVDFNGAADLSYGAAIQSDGGIILVGSTGTDFAIARLSTRVSFASATFEYETQHRVDIKFSTVPISLTAGDFDVVNLTTGVPVPDANLALATAPDGTKLLTFPGYAGGVLPDGNYRVTLPPGTFTDGAGTANSVTSTFDFFVLAGDANRDRTVNFDDLLLLAKNYNTNGKTFSTGNFDYSAGGGVDFNDLLALAKRYNQVLTPAVLPFAAASSSPTRKREIETIV